MTTKKKEIFSNDITSPAPHSETILGNIVEKNNKLLEHYIIYQQVMGESKVSLVKLVQPILSASLIEYFQMRRKYSGVKKWVFITLPEK